MKAAVLEVNRMRQPKRCDVRKPNVLEAPTDSGEGCVANPHMSAKTVIPRAIWTGFLMVTGHGDCIDAIAVLMQFGSQGLSFTPWL
jgi:hypothetical protein